VLRNGSAGNKREKGEGRIQPNEYSVESPLAIESLAIGAWLLTLVMRKNRAAVRHWLWLSASVKFLIPFSLLVSFGSLFQWRLAPEVALTQVSSTLEEIGQPFCSTCRDDRPVVG